MLLCAVCSFCAPTINGYFPPIECAFRMKFVANRLFPHDECQRCEWIILFERSRKSGVTRQPLFNEWNAVGMNELNKGCRVTPDFRLSSNRIIHEHSDIHHKGKRLQRISWKCSTQEVGNELFSNFKSLPNEWLTNSYPFHAKFAKKYEEISIFSH